MTTRDRSETSPAPPEPVTARGVRRWFFSGLAGVFLVLGALGAILPGLPTTPFLLLASYFLSRTSPRWNRMLLKSKFFGPILSDWQKHRGVRPDVKVQAIVIVVLCVAVSIWLSGPNWWFSAGIVAVSAIGIGVIVRLPAVKADRASCEDGGDTSRGDE